MAESVLLLLLHYEPSHGYTLLERLGEFGLGAMDPSAVYRTLRNMEDRGLVLSSWDELETLGPPRRVYGITDKGDQMLDVWMQDLVEMQQLLDRLVGEYRSHKEECRGEHYPRAAGTEPAQAGRG